jgi:hypothetical protein
LGIQKKTIEAPWETHILADYKTHRHMDNFQASYEKILTYLKTISTKENSNTPPFKNLGEFGINVRRHLNLAS